MPPKLQTARLTLRRFADDDLDGLLAVFGDPEVMRFVGRRRAPLDREALVAAQAAVAEHWRAHGFGALAVVERAGGALVGECGLQLLEGGPDVELTYTLGRAHWGRGYATEAAATVLAWGLGTLGLERVVGVAYPENLASHRVLEKVGMRRVGVRHCYGADLVEFVAEGAAGGGAAESPGAAAILGS